MALSTSTLTGVVKEHVEAVNAFDVDRIMATFHEDAYVNDYNREIRGSEQIRNFFQNEFSADKCTMDVKTVTDHHGDVILKSLFDGTFDRSMLPDPEAPVITTYYAVRDDKIISLFIETTAPWPGPPARLMENPPRAFDPDVDLPAVWPYGDSGPAK